MDKQSAKTRDQARAAHLRAKAQPGLGRGYREGVVAGKDYKTALFRLLEAAILGNPEAQTLLGLMYVGGPAVIQDDKEAVYWFRKAAAQGNEDAKKALALLGEK